MSDAAKSVKDYGFPPRRRHCDGFGQPCGRDAQPPYRFCDEHLEAYIENDPLLYAVRHLARSENRTRGEQRG